MYSTKRNQIWKHPGDTTFLHIQLIRPVKAIELKKGCRRGDVKEGGSAEVQ